PTASRASSSSATAGWINPESSSTPSASTRNSSKAGSSSDSCSSSSAQLIVGGSSIPEPSPAARSSSQLKSSSVPASVNCEGTLSSSLSQSGRSSAGFAATSPTLSCPVSWSLPSQSNASPGASPKSPNTPASST